MLNIGRYRASHIQQRLLLALMLSIYFHTLYLCFWIFAHLVLLIEEGVVQGSGYELRLVTYSQFCLQLSLRDSL